MISTLKQLLSAPAVSGGEQDRTKILESLLSPSCDRLYTDTLGNLVAIKQSGKAGAKKLLLSAPMDECGIIVNDADGEGRLRFATVGSYSLSSFAYREVRFEGGLRGTLLPLGSLKSDGTASDFAVDIGAKDKKDALKRVRIGTLGAFSVPYRRLLGNRVTAHSLCGTVGCALLCHLLQHCDNTAYDLFAVFTVQQEVGSRGAAVAAFDLAPDLALILDGTPASAACKVGKGVGIKKKDKHFLCDMRYSNALAALADEKKIDYQIEIQCDYGSDAFAIQKSCGGVRTAALSVPIAQMHTPAETIALSDLESAYHLLETAVTSGF